MSASAALPAGTGHPYDDAVVALDAPLAGRTRRAYFERRLAVALRQPELHLQFAAVSGKEFLGHALARVLEGEFGHTQPALRLEVISVAPQAQRRGIGRALHAALEDEARKRSIAELRTVAAWRDHDLLRFLDGLGYELAPSEVLECTVHGSALLAPCGRTMRIRTDPVGPTGKAVSSMAAGGLATGETF